jgi:hypothetical protein
MRWLSDEMREAAIGCKRIIDTIRKEPENVLRVSNRIWQSGLFQHGGASFIVHNGALQLAEI